MAYEIDKQLLRSVLALCLLSCIPPTHAGFGPSATAREWCKNKTLHYLEKRGYIPYNWEATTYIEGNDYVTKGVWRVDVDNIEVQCTSNKHATKPSGRYKILDIEITDGAKPTKH
jgi:hypothetical protein